MKDSIRGLVACCWDFVMPVFFFFRFKIILQLHENKDTFGIEESLASPYMFTHFCQGRCQQSRSRRFLISVHTEKIGSTLIKGSIFAGGRTVMPHETSFPGYRLRNTADIFLTLFFLFSLTLEAHYYAFLCERTKHLGFDELPAATISLASVLPRCF